MHLDNHRLFNQYKVSLLSNQWRIRDLTLRGRDFVDGRGGYTIIGTADR